MREENGRKKWLDVVESDMKKADVSKKYVVDRGK